MFMKEKILKIILVLLVAVTVIISIIVAFEKKENFSKNDDAPMVTNDSFDMINLSDDVVEQIVDDYKFNSAKLYYGSSKSTFLVDIHKDNNTESKKLIGIKINFVDNNDNLIYSIDVPNIEYISYPFMYSTTVETDLRKTKSIKYELEYEE